MFLLVALAGFVIDLGTKSWVFSRLWPPTPDKPAYLWLWQGHIGLQVSLNQGAVFGIGQGWVFWFALLSVLAVAGILYWLFVLGEAKDWWLTIALGGITAGIFGNLYDRLGLHGLLWPEGLIGGNHPGTPIYAVRDWILFQWNDAWRCPILILQIACSSSVQYFCFVTLTRQKINQHPIRKLKIQKLSRSTVTTDRQGVRPRAVD